MNWQEVLRRCLIVVTVLSVSFFTFIGWQKTENVYEIRNADGAWETASAHCISGTVERSIAATSARTADFAYNFVGECHTLEPVLVGLLVGLALPASLLIIYLIFRWILRGFYSQKTAPTAETKTEGFDV